MIQDHPPNLWSFLIALVTAVPTIITIWWTQRNAAKERAVVKKTLEVTTARQDTKLDDIHKEVNGKMTAAKEELKNSAVAIADATKEIASMKHDAIRAISDTAAVEVNKALYTIPPSVTGEHPIMPKP